MATIVCQGLQSCLESHLVEPRTLRLKLSAPLAHHFSATPQEFLGIKSCFSESNRHIKDLSEEKCYNEETSSNKAGSENPDLGGWSFLQAVSNITSEIPPKVDKDNVYIPPQIYKSPSATKLTDKSLGLCTEDLGCETGAIITEEKVFSSPGPDAESDMVPREQPKQRNVSGGKKGNVVHSFPPPLTTISGSDSLQFRPHREDGRLIIKAVKAPLTHSCFQAERSNGRLRLSFLKSFAPNLDSEETAATQEDSEGCENEAHENDRNEEEETEQQGQEVVGEKTKEEELMVEKFEGDKCLIEAEEDADGNSLNVGGEEGMDKFERPSRCKEGGEHEKKGLLNWEAVWVAT